MTTYTGELKFYKGSKYCISRLGIDYTVTLSGSNYILKITLTNQIKGNQAPTVVDGYCYICSSTVNLPSCLTSVTKTGNQTYYTTGTHNSTYYGTTYHYISWNGVLGGDSYSGPSPNTSSWTNAFVETLTFTIPGTSSARTVLIPKYSYDQWGPDYGDAWYYPALSYNAINHGDGDSTPDYDPEHGFTGATLSGDISITIPALPTYTVSYNANGGSGAPSSQTKTHGVSLTLSSTKPTRTNYVFYHWNTNSSNTGTSYNSGGSYTANAAATLYAIWNPVISYNANGGSGAPSSQTKTYGVDLTLSSTVPTRASHEFLGWATSASGSVAYSPGGKYTANTPVTLYAVWKLLAPQASITSVTRVDSSGNADILGGCLKVQGTWEILNQSAASTPTITASGSQTKSDSSTVSLALLGTPTIGTGTFSLLLGAPPNHSGSPAYAYPQYAASVSVTVSDTVTPTTVTASINADANYVYPTASISSAARRNSNATNDALGGYARVVVSYSMMEATAAASQTGTFPITATAAGTTLSDTIAETSPTGTKTFNFGNGTIADFPPDEAVGVTVTLSDYFSTVTKSLSIPIDSSYHAPTAGVASYTRCDSQGNADDLGGYIKFAVLYDFYNSPSRKANYSLKILDALDSADITRQEGSSTRTYGKFLAPGSMTVGSAATWNIIMPYAPYNESGTAGYEALIDAATSYLAKTTISDTYKTVSAIANIPVSPYTTPAITSLTVYRSNANGVPEDDGMYCTVVMSWNIYATRSQTGITSLTLEAINPVGVVEQTRDVTSLVSGTSGVDSTFVFGNDDLSQDAIYTIRVTLEDSLNTTVRSDNIFDAFFPMDFLMGGHGVSFGKPAHQAGFNVSMKPYAFEQEDAPVYYYNTQPAEANVPVKPCVVVALDTGKAYLYY